MTAAAGQLIAGRYRLERLVLRGPRASLWRAGDDLVGGVPVALWQVSPRLNAAQVLELWSRWQQVLHPQVPRLGGRLEHGEGLWLVREWQVGRSYQELRQRRADRRLVFGAGEVLLLLRQILPVLALLHRLQLVHGDLRPAQLLRREGDGLPVLLDFGLLTSPGRPLPAPPEPWRDLHDLALVALSLISGADPAQLRDPRSGGWCWPTALAAEPALQQAMARLASEDPGQRFGSTQEAQVAFDSLPMPESTGPVPRLEPCLTAPQPLPLPPRRPPRPRRSARQQEREEAVEGGLWPVLIALVLSAVVGTALGWWWLGRGRPFLQPTPEAAQQWPGGLPQLELDQRQQLLNRLRALQVDRSWFVALVNAALLERHPERAGQLPGVGAADAGLRREWESLAEDWLVRVEQLSLEIRRRLGSFRFDDWELRLQELLNQGLSPAVVRELVSADAQALLPGQSRSDLPPEPFRQLWLAAAEQLLSTMRIEPIRAQSGSTQVVSAEVAARGARLFPIRLPAGHSLVLGVNGSPLTQMSVYGQDGALLERRGPLRVLSLSAQPSQLVQLLVDNEGLAPALITLSLRADPPPPELEPAVDELGFPVEEPGSGSAAAPGPSPRSPVERRQPRGWPQAPPPLPQAEPPPLPPLD